MSSEKRFLHAYEELSDALFRHAYYRILDRHKAQDLMQETFVRIWNAITEKHTIENMRAFAYTVLNHLIIDDVRKKKPVSFSPLDTDDEKGFDPPSNDHAILETHIEAEHLLGVLGELDPECRDLITMRFVDDLSIKEIAALTNERENTVSVRIHRALEKIRGIAEKKNNEKNN